VDQQAGARAAIDSMLLAFNPHQRRGPDGRWVKMGDHEKKSARPRATRKAAAPTASGRERLNGLLDGESHDLTPAELDQMAEFFRLDDPTSGWSLKPVDGSVRGNDRKQLRFRAQLVDRDGHWVGDVSRSFTRNPDGTLSVSHEAFSLKESARGGGVSSRWLAKMEDRYRDAGVREITLQTEKVGGYAWAKAGFDFADRGEVKAIGSRFNRVLKSRDAQRDLPQRVLTDGEELVRRSQSKDPGEWPTPMEFAMLGWAPEADTWVGKQAMIGSSWDGVKRL
jgi:hypothetical protein